MVPAAGHRVAGGAGERQSRAILLTPAGFPVCILLTPAGFPVCILLTPAGFPVCILLTPAGFPVCILLTPAGFPVCAVYPPGRLRHVHDRHAERHQGRMATRS